MNNRRNSFLELFRFIFSLFILFYHGLFFFDIPAFRCSNFFVDFFFITSGLFCVSVIEKYDEYPIFKGAWELIKDRLRKFGIPFAIGCFFAAISWIYAEDRIFSPRLMWFILTLVGVYLLYYFLRRILKDEKKFYKSVVIILVLSLLIRFFGIIRIDNKIYTQVVEKMFNIDEIRGFYGVSAGILINKMPDLKFKSEQNRSDFLFVTFVTGVVLVGIGIYTSTINQYAKIVTELPIDLIGFPIIVYSSRYYKFNNRVINYLGSLSPLIYIYQQIPYSLGGVIELNGFFRFMLVLLPVVITVWVEYKYLKKKKHSK